MASLHDEYLRIRSCTEKICAPLHTEDYVVQPALFVSPPKWHLAHTSWFFEQFLLKDYCAGYEEYHPDFGFLFNSYYNNVGNRVMRINRGNITRPGVAEIYKYRAHVDVNMQLLLQGDLSGEVRQIILLGLNHEQQHQELLLTDIKFILGNNPLFPIYREGLNWENQHNEKSGFITIPEGLYEIGATGKEGFAFDNELGRHKVYLEEFSISESLVTNGDFIEFINNGGYENFNLWLDEGWTWIRENNITHPLYWHKTDNVWHQFTISGLKPVDQNAILTHISFYEASAFAAWKQMRLPTEFEWEVAAPDLSWGKRWEWTSSAYQPYPRYKKADGAIGEYNGKFMINQIVLRGGSCATPENHTRISYRNFFHPDERWQFNGIRLVR